MRIAAYAASMASTTMEYLRVQLSLPVSSKNLMEWHRFSSKVYRKCRKTMTEILVIGTYLLVRG